MRALALPWVPALAAFLFLAHGCATEPRPAELMQVGPQAAANREAQTRRFENVSETELLAACVGVLQDQSFRITTSEARLGVITGIKSRSHEEILGDVFRQALLASVTLGLHPDVNRGPPDSFGVVLTTRGVGGPSRAHEVRVTFYWTWGHLGPHSPEKPLFGPQSPDKPLSAKPITSPELYQQFFGMLSATLARSRSGN